MKSGITHRILSDHLGSQRIVLNAGSGKILQDVGYDESANVTSDSNPGFQPFGFAGGIFDLDTKLVRFAAPQPGDKTSSTAGPAQKGTIDVGGYHTHGSYDPDYDGESFSDLDKAFADANGTRAYLGTPSGKLKRYIADPNKHLQGKIDTLGHCTCK